MLLAADDGDTQAERELYRGYQADDGLHPGPVVVRASPYGDPLIDVDLAARSLP